MKEQLEEIRSRAMAELGDESTRDQIENVRVRVLGRAGELTTIMRSMRDVPASERPAMGQLVNQIKSEIEARITELLERIDRQALEKSLREERIDVTLPGLHIPRGKLHPVTQVLEQMLGIFVSLG